MFLLRHRLAFAGFPIFIAVLFLQNSSVTFARPIMAGDPIPPSLLHPISPPGSYDTPPKLVRGFFPWYPLRQAQIRKPGQVTVEFNVGLDGKTNDIKIISSTGYGFWKYSQWAVEKWKFEPALKKGQPVVVRLRVVFNFHA